jgi:hypothetical protein
MGTRNTTATAVREAPATDRSGATAAPTAAGTRSVSEHAVRARVRKRLVTWVVVGVVGIAAIGVAIVATIPTPDGARPETTERATVAPAVGPQEFLARLAAQGYIPSEAVDQRQLQLERAIAGGHVPAATLQPDGRALQALYTPHELRLIEAVRAGHVPKESLGAESLRLKMLAEEAGLTLYELRVVQAVRAGHVPKQTLDTRTFRVRLLADEGADPAELAR